MKTTPGPQKSNTEREQEVRRTEQEVDALEGQQAAEMSRLEARAGEMYAKLQQFKVIASRAGLEESDEPDAAGLQQRLETAAVPPADFGRQREELLAARLEAARLRTKACERTRKALADYDAELSQLVQQLAAEEQVLRRHQTNRDEAARRAREAKQRAADEAARETRQRAAAASMHQARTEPEMPVVPPGPRSTPASPRSAPVSPEQTSTLPGQAPEPRRTRIRMQASIDLHSESNFFQGFSTNLSEGGLFIATVQMLPRGTQVDLRFTLPGGKKIDAKGVVRWTREANDLTPDIFPGVGVQFVDLPSDASHAIREFISEREPLFFPE